MVDNACFIPLLSRSLVIIHRLLLGNPRVLNLQEMRHQAFFVLVAAVPAAAPTQAGAAAAISLANGTRKTNRAMFRW
jgi:hypothetical protein